MIILYNTDHARSESSIQKRTQKKKETINKKLRRSTPRRRYGRGRGQARRADADAVLRRQRRERVGVGEEPVPPDRAALQGRLREARAG